MKLCPILLAGTRVSRLVSLDHRGSGYRAEHNGCQCFKEGCEWYGAGCPAYPDQAAVNLASEVDATKD